MEKKKRTKAPSMEDLIPDAKRRQEVIRRLYNNESLLGKGGIFTDMLQSMVNAALEGEMDYTLETDLEAEQSSIPNRRNGHIDK
jgi:putative transposase